MALEAAVCLASGLAFCEAAFDVGDRLWVCAFACDEDLVQGAVEFAVAGAVEAVADRLAGGRGGWCCAGESGEGGFGVDTSLGVTGRGRVVLRRAVRRPAGRAAVVPVLV